MTIDINRAKESAAGFLGRFFYDAERGDLAYIAKACDDRTCNCERKTNSDGDQDCSVCIGDMDHGADTGEPIAQMLNAVPDLIAEVERLRLLCREACDVIDGLSDQSDRVEIVHAYRGYGRRFATKTRSSLDGGG